MVTKYKTMKSRNRRKMMRDIKTISILENMINNNRIIMERRMMGR